MHVPLKCGLCLIKNETTFTEVRYYENILFVKTIRLSVVYFLVIFSLDVFGSKFPLPFLFRFSVLVNFKVLVRQECENGDRMGRRDSEVTID